MRAILFFSKLFFSINFVCSQNLVPNPSFELYNACPPSYSQIDYTGNWNQPTDHYGTSDFIHTCSSPVPSSAINYFKVTNLFHGNGCAGLYTYKNAREYIQTKLVTPMVANVNYRVSFRVKKATGSLFVSCNRIGMYISAGPINGAKNSSALTSYVPQIEYTNFITDTANWTLVSGIYKAVGGEDYITLGNFRDDLSSVSLGGKEGLAYYLIDSVIIEKSITKAKFGISDSVICVNDCVNLIDKTEGNPVSTEWAFFDKNMSINQVSHLQNICFTKPGVYSARQIVSDGSKFDTAHATVRVVLECIKHSLYIPNAFTLNNDGINDVFMPKGTGIKNYNMMIFNRWGQEIFETNDLNTGWDGKYNGAVCPQDVYLYKISYVSEEDNKAYSSIGKVSLFR